MIVKYFVFDDDVVVVDVVVVVVVVVVLPSNISVCFSMCLYSTNVHVSVAGESRMFRDI